MPKLNPYLIENKAQVEEIREINNKVPSFEEFMESNENLNYDDLTFSDISDKGKGYGPCGGSFCPHTSSFYVKISLNISFGYIEYFFVTKDSTYTTYYTSRESHKWNFVSQWAGLFQSRHEFWQTNYLVIRDEDLARKILSGLGGSGQSGICVLGVDNAGNPHTPPGWQGYDENDSDCVEKRRKAERILRDAVRKHAQGDEINETHNI